MPIRLSKLMMLSIKTLVSIAIAWSPNSNCICMEGRHILCDQNSRHVRYKSVIKQKLHDELRDENLKRHVMNMPRAYATSAPNHVSIDRCMVCPSCRGAFPGNLLAAHADGLCICD